MEEEEKVKKEQKKKGELFQFQVDLVKRQENLGDFHLGLESSFHWPGFAKISARLYFPFIGQGQVLNTAIIGQI